MAKNIQYQFNYTGTGYLDSKMSVSSIDELIAKWDFEGQSVSMPSAFVGSNGVPYPVDFWLIPYGDIDKWEIKTMPSIESDEDLEKFKDFINEFKEIAGYYPLSEGAEILVNGETYSFLIDENDKATYVSSQETIDGLISDTVENAVGEAVNKVTSGASEAFDTLKEVEEWIKSTPNFTDFVKKQYVDEKIAELEVNFNWIDADENGTHKVKNWRGSRENYEFLLKNNALDSWTRYSVIDIVGEEKVITEYFGDNQISELTGQLLPVKSILQTVEEAEVVPYNRYLIGEDGVGYSIYECLFDSENNLRWRIGPFDYRHGVRVVDKGLKNYIYYDNMLRTYDDIDGGVF